MPNLWDPSSWRVGARAKMFDLPDDLTDDAARDLDRGFFHNNTEGVITEAWFHLYGCRRWVTVKRDTRTDKFLPT